MHSLLCTKPSSRNHFPNEVSRAYGFCHTVHGVLAKQDKKLHPDTSEHKDNHCWYRGSGPHHACGMRAPYILQSYIIYQAPL